VSDINGPFETDRLLLRRAVPEDRDSFIELNADPDVMRFIGTERRALTRGTKESEEKADQHLAAASHQDGLQLWIIEWLKRPGFLGWVGLFELPGSGNIEVGYRLMKNAWGHGIATEAATYMVQHGLRVMKLPMVCAVTYPENEASRKVLEKAGLAYIGIRRYYDVDTAYFEIHA